MIKKQQCKTTLVVGNNITAYRKTKEMTQARLAEILGITVESLSRIECGHVAPRLPRLEDIAEILECSVSDLFRTPEELAKIKFSDYSQIPLLDAAAEINLLAERIVTLSKQLKK